MLEVVLNDCWLGVFLAAAGGERASYRFFEFFTAQIRNPNTFGRFWPGGRFIDYPNTNPSARNPTRTTTKPAKITALQARIK